MVIFHLLTQAVCSTFISQCGPLFSHIMIYWLKEKKGEDVDAGELKKNSKKWLQDLM